MLHHLIKGSKDQAASIEEDKGAKGALNIGGASNPTLDKKSNQLLLDFFDSWFRNWGTPKQSQVCQ